MTDTPKRPARLERHEIVSLGFFAIGPHIEKLYDYIDYLEGRSGTPVRELPNRSTFESLDAYIEELERGYQEGQQFYCDGPLPAGYEIHMVVSSTEEPVPAGMKLRTPTKARAQRIDKTWTGPWRKSGQGGLIVGDAWKHVTGAKNVEVDEAGGHRDG